MARYIYIVAMVIWVSGCSEFDMQGYDPKDYRAQHPIKNEVEIRHVAYTAQFHRRQDTLSPGQLDELKAALGEAEPMASEQVRITVHPAQMKNEERQRYLTKLLRAMGYANKIIRFEPSDAMKANEAEIDITYAAVVPPQCPDWTGSPVVSYSNTGHSNFGCASVVNLGLQVADPHDLVKGEGDLSPDSERNALVIRQYHAGQPVGGDAAAAAGDTAAAAGALLGGGAPAQ